ncbi:hypothetical protein Rhopal_001473-T1 [Rhodotorula paludigena]|uniref:HORMA domain-containing protein n=1 Tax=Rhodotorula paludigena TaxID=86838 RepID=A0AAV5GHG1_9BASI|nr:hypothetical protein Rhopal_001473-T1 [Rhodotorula paludigena]
MSTTRLKPTQVDSAVTLRTSLQQELLEAGIGCVAFLRGLLPEDSFEDYKLLAPRPPVSRSSTTGKDDEDKSKQAQPSSVRVKKLRRGVSLEADKLLDYLELGATQAIEKGYLHQLIFAIYLDPDDPTNLVESYTFTFSYETDAEGNKASRSKPELVVQDQLSGMVISPSAYGTTKEPPRKEGDVKRQVQQMIKNLITSTQVLDELPRRRFLNIRLFYTDETPPDYEPPCFHPVEVDMPGYSLTTPSVADPPDFGTLGSMATGFHGVALHTVSIAHLLDTPFDEHITVDEALSRNRHDASSRAVVWNAESLVESATDEDAKLKVVEPVAIRDRSGLLRTVEEVSESAEADMAELRKVVGIEHGDEAMILAKGELEETLCDSNLSDNAVLRRAIASTEKRASSTGGPATQLDPVISRQRSYMPPVPLFAESREQYHQRAEAQQHQQQQAEAGPSGLTSAEKAVVKARVKEQEVLPQVAETQLFDYSQMDIDKDEAAASETYEPEPDTIQTADLVEAPTPPQKQREERPARPVRKSTRSRARTAEDACECGDKEDDGAMICCSTCDIWKHAVCYGFDSIDDQRIPDVFVCYRCEAQIKLEEAAGETEREGEIEQALAEFRTLALFRRAIAVIWQDGMLTMKELAKRLEIDNSTAGQVIKRLKAEDFVVEQSASSRRHKGKSGSQVGSLKQGVQVVNKSAKQTKRKQNEYFRPGNGAELGIKALFDGLTDDQEQNDDDASTARAPSSRALSKLIQLASYNTPSPAQPAFGNRTATQEDPILDPLSQPQQSSTLLFSTPAKSVPPAAALPPSGGLPIPSRQSTEMIAPQPSYVPSCEGKKGKNKDVGREVSASLQAFSAEEPVPMEVDRLKQQQRQQPSSSMSKGKRRTMSEVDVNLEAPVAGSTRSKRQRCSEADEIEV